MASIPLPVVAALLGAVLVYLFALGFLKIVIFRHFDVA